MHINGGILKNNENIGESACFGMLIQAVAFYYVFINTQPVVTQI